MSDASNTMDLSQTMNDIFTGTDPVSGKTTSNEMLGESRVPISNDAAAAAATVADVYHALVGTTEDVSATAFEPVDMSRQIDKGSLQ